MTAVVTASAGHRRYVTLTGGPLDRCRIRVEPHETQILVPGHRGRYVADPISATWFWETDAR